MYRKIMICTLLLLFPLHVAVAGVDHWTTSGPYGGLITTLSKNSSSTIYAGTFSAGIFKSVDSGANWVAVNNGLSNPAAINAVVVNPATQTTVYAGIWLGGVIKSIDGGANWSAANTGLTNLDVYALAIDPATPTTLYAGTWGGVFKSIDSGASWSEVNTGLGYRQVYTLAINPNAPGTLYAGTDTGVYKTSNGGVNWATANTGLTNLNVLSLEINPATPATVYAGTKGGVFKSIDSGVNWSGKGLTSMWISTLAIDLTAPTTVYAGGSYAAHKSTDGGTTWSPMFTTNTETVNALVINPVDTTVVYAGIVQSGMRKSTDGGAIWSAINTGITALGIESFAFDPSTPGVVYAGGNKTVYKSSDNGTTWTSSLVEYYPDTASSLAIDPAIPSMLYAGMTYYGAFKSSDGGAHWSGAYNGLTQGWPSGKIHSLAIDPVTPGILYAGTEEGVYKSIDNGGLWFAANNGISNPQSCTIFAVAIDPTSPSTVYSACYGYGIYKSANSGGVWSLISNATLSTPTVRSLLIDPSTPTTLFAGTTTGGVFKSTDGGVNWSVMNTGLTNLTVYALTMNPAAPGTLAAATYGGGIFRSIDGGAHWSSLNTGLLNLNRRSIAINPANPKMLYSGSSGDSVELYQISGPAMEISDSVAPVYDHAVPFGNVASATSSDQTIFISNKGNAALVIGTIGGANPLAAPFSTTADSCSGQTVAPTGTCTVTVRFAPSSSGIFDDTFTIPSNDPDALSIVVTVSGTGTTPVPNITVTDSVSPAQDLQIPFGNVTQNITADQTITVSNPGNASLIIGTIASVNPLVHPFSITVDHCSGQILTPGGSCVLTVRFAPTTGNVFTDTFDIPSGDPDSPTVTITVSGTGLSSAQNNPPAAPALLFPSNGQIGVGSSVFLTWQKSQDPDGDLVGYQVVYCTDQNFIGCSPVHIASNGKPTVLYAGMVSGTALLVTMTITVLIALGRRTRFLMPALILLASMLLFASCSGSSNVDGILAADEITYPVAGLNARTTYYWKVIADDGKGGSTASEVWSFTTL